MTSVDPAAASPVGTARPAPGALHAIVLTGGRGSRLGGVDKAALRLDGPAGGTLGRTVLDAVPGPGVTVVVGAEVPADAAADPAAGRTVVRALEDPPGSGPLAGIAAGLAALPDDTGTAGDETAVALLACDLPSVDAATVDRLLAALHGTGAVDGDPGEAGAAGGDDDEVSDAVLATDDEGRDQYLLAVWRRRALADRLAALGDPAGLPVRRLVEGARIRRVTVGAAARDVDTWSDVAARGPLGVDLLGRALAAGITPLTARTVPALEAEGALATDLVAADAMPRMPVSAMDGYALAGPGPWRLLDRARRAGDATTLRLSSGECVPIATGALAPAGTERTLRHELVAVEGARVHALPAADGVDDLRPVGEDWPGGETLLPAGTVVDAAVRSVALSAGVRELTVRGPVRARLFTTGDEVLPSDAPDPLPPGRIRDTAGPVLPGVLAAAGMRVVGRPAHVPDDPDALAGILGGGPGRGPGGVPDGARDTGADAADDVGVEVLVLVGATGRGPADHLRPVLDRLGARLLVDGVRMRPGGSQLVAELPDGTILLALPGNPLAAVCAAAVTGRLVVDALTLCARPPELARVPAVADLAAPGRTRVLPARPDPAGGWEIARTARTSHLLDLAGSTALVVVPRGAVDGTPVEVLRWA